LLIALLVLLSAGQTFAQQPAPKREPSHKYRTILTIAGAGAGFATGFYVGFNAFDDAVNSDRKLWTTSAITAAGGAVGGYFIGRALDNRRNRISLGTDRVNVTPVVSGETKGVQFSIRF
jgi:hypothetical protein